MKLKVGGVTGQLLNEGKMREIGECESCETPVLTDRGLFVGGWEERR